MKRNKWILMGSGIALGAVALAGAASYNITKKMVKVALDREEPKAMGKSKELFTGNENIKETLEMQSIIAEKLENLNLETIEILAGDGTKLVGHLYLCENAERTIIAMHGWRSSWSKDFGLIADFLFESKCNVIFAEQRGQGESGGECMGFGLVERFDCLDWIKWVSGQVLGNLPVYLIGISMGAATVLMTTGFDLPENIKGVIADCGFTSPHEIWKHVAKNMHLSYSNIYSNIASNLCKKKINYGTADYSTSEAMKKCSVPVLFIHGTDDKFVPIEMTFENYKECSAPKRLFIVPGAEHGMSYVVDKEGYEKTVKQFWDDFDNS